MQTLSELYKSCFVAYSKALNGEEAKIEWRNFGTVGTLNMRDVTRRPNPYGVVGKILVYEGTEARFAAWNANEVAWSAMLSAIRLSFPLFKDAENRAFWRDDHEAENCYSSPTRYFVTELYDALKHAVNFPPAANPSLAYLLPDNEELNAKMNDFLNQFA